MERDVVEILSRLSPHSHIRANPLGSGKAPGYEPGEVAAMLTGLERPVCCLAFARYALDPDAHQELAAWLRVEALRLRKRQHWDIDPNDTKLTLLADLARDDLTLSRPQLGRKKAADWLGVSEYGWRHTWSDRHAALIRIGNAWHSQLTYRLIVQLRGTYG